METQDNNRPHVTQQILATDLDGTLIPLAGNEQNQSDLETLTDQLGEHGVTLIYITGRHFASASEAIGQFGLPQPDWLICDVGTSIFLRQDSGTFIPVEDYLNHQDRIIAALPMDGLRRQLQDLSGLRLQEPEKQGRFKLSFYADAAQLHEVVVRIQQKLDETAAPYSIIHSVDPFNGDGLIDLLPTEVSKAHALAWWADHAGFTRESIVVSGDSGNDFSALTAGYRAIVVGNADRSLVRSVYDSHRESAWQHRLCLAHGLATSGVLEGCRWFGLVKPERRPIEGLGATPVTDDQTHFRVWAPHRKRVTVAVDVGGRNIRQALIAEEHGYFAGCVPQVGPGSRYHYVLDDDIPRPDPATTFQPEGVHGPSEVIDHRGFPWTDQQWPGVRKRDLVIYELHVGTFTQSGTFRAAIDRIPELIHLGVTAVELMPIVQSPGRWNWGYDGVDLFAVRNTYGQPDDFKALVDACHSAGLAVILDVVYNHVGPEGNYLAEFGPYFSSRHHTPWGEAFNFDHHNSEHVRRFIVKNAVFWLDTFHVDGLRLDAVHFIQDDSDVTILDEIRRTTAEYSRSANRIVHLIAETNVYDDAILRKREQQPAYDAIWCDCLMQSIYSHAVPDLRLTRREYDGARDLAETLRYGYVFEGPDQTRVMQRTSDRSQSERERRHIESFVVGLQNHDSVGNQPHGKRIHQLTSKDFQRAAAALTILYPGIPLLFMGEEFAIDSPFGFFVDFEDPQLQRAVVSGRAKEYPGQLQSDNTPLSDSTVFESAKCDDTSRQDREMFQWYRDLIQLRKTGLAEGWLAIDRMSTRHHEADDVFVLQFDCEDGGRVSVQARLTMRAQPEVVAIPLDGDILLSSLSDPAVIAGRVSLGRNHVVVSRT